MAVLNHYCKFDKKGCILIQKGRNNVFLPQICPFHGTRECDCKYCGDWCPLLEECLNGNDFIYFNCGKFSDKKFQLIEDERN